MDACGITTYPQFKICRRFGLAEKFRVNYRLLQLHYSYYHTKLHLIIQLNV